MCRCGDGSGGGGGSGGGPKYVVSKVKMLGKKHTYGQETSTSMSLGLFFHLVVVVVESLSPLVVVCDSC